MQHPAGFSPILDLPFGIGSRRPLFETKLEYFGNLKKKSLWAVVLFDDRFVGPPGHVHGGAQAYVLDDAMGTVCWNCLIPVVAKSITINFKKPAPLNSNLVITAQVTGKKGRDTLVKAAILHDDQLLATGKGIFHILTQEYLSKLKGRAAAPDLSRWFPTSGT